MRLFSYSAREEEPRFSGSYSFFLTAISVRSVENAVNKGGETDGNDVEQEN